LRLAIEYPDRDLNRLTSALRVFTVIPILVLLATIGGFSAGAGAGASAAVGGAGMLFLPVALMIVFRQRYPRWWFDWNVALMRFSNRIAAYAMLMDDRYPATEDEQAVHLEIDYPDARATLNRWLPLVKWLLAIPHYVVLVFLHIGAILAAIGAWFVILATRRYPRGIFDFIEGVIRWNNRVVAYAFILVTDRYPPFRLRP
jgi:hypothetical protein